MENCCGNLCCVFKKQNKKQIQKKTSKTLILKTVVLKEPTGREIGLRYDLGRELGRGEFGITYLCKDKETNEELACKSISKNKLTTAINIEHVRREVEIMRQLPKHPNIVSLTYTYEDDDNVCLVRELCGGGHLLDRIVDRGYFTERAAASVIKTIVEVVQMCHEHGVMHRNLKLENVMFADNTETAHLKVTDFRWSIFFEPGERLNHIVGNLYYMAPEVLMRNYGPEIDIWSAGVILYILLCGFPPFWAETEQGVAQAIIRSKINFNRDPWQKVSNNAKHLVKRMLDPDPKLRLTAQEVLDHPWLIKILKMKPDKTQKLVNKMLNAHGVLDHPWLQNAKTAPNVSLGEKVRAKLLKFSVMNVLTRTTSMVIADNLSAAEFAKNSDKLWDLHTESTINPNELQLRLYMLGNHIPDVDVERLISAFDIGEYGLDYGEFLAISVHLRKRSHAEQVDRAFNFFDRHQSGYIALEELRMALAETDEIDTSSKDIINAIMHDVATNKDGDGRISYEQITNRQWATKTNYHF